MVVVMMFASMRLTNADAALDTYLEVTPFMDEIPFSETSGGSPPVAEVPEDAKVVRERSQRALRAL